MHSELHHRTSEYAINDAVLTPAKALVSVVVFDTASSAVSGFAYRVWGGY